MSTRALRPSARGLLIASLPLAIAVGCATGESQPPSVAAVSVQDGAAQSDFSFESYLDRIDEPRTPEVSIPVEAKQQTLTEMETSEPAAVSEANAAAADDADRPIEQPDAAATELEPAETAVRPSTPRPISQVVYFGFDQSEVDAEDRAALEQHAEYLLENPRTAIIVAGHADNRGPKAYNQHLSELRAKRVAGVLIELGVPEERITIQALGAEDPATDLQRWHENRRVEIRYEDAYLVMSP